MIRNKAARTDKVSSATPHSVNTGWQKVDLDPLRLRGIAFAQGQMLRLLAKTIVTHIADVSDSNDKG